MADPGTRVRFTEKAKKRFPKENLPNQAYVVFYDPEAHHPYVIMNRDDTERWLCYYPDIEVLGGEGLSLSDLEKATQKSFYELLHHPRRNFRQ